MKHLDAFFLTCGILGVGMFAAFVGEVDPQVRGEMIATAPPPGVVVAAAADSPVPLSGRVESVAAAQPCNNTHTAESGDSWWQIADMANMSMDALLENNNAITTTLILIGDPICLPVGANVSRPSSTTTTTPPPAPTSPVIESITSPVGVTDSTPTTLPPAVRIIPQVVVPADNPVGVDGDCDSWRPLVEAEGIPWDWAKRIMWRESRCEGTAHNGNRGTGDHSHGLFQVNALGYLGDWYAASGYTHDVLHTAEGAIKAAGALYALCGGGGPWQPPYSCNGNGPLRTYQP